MNPLTIINITNIALGLLKGSVGGNVGNVMNDLLALEQIAAAVAQEYQSLAGKPLDLSLLTYEEPIEESQ